MNFKNIIFLKKTIDKISVIGYNSNIRTLTIAYILKIKSVFAIHKN